MLSVLITLPCHPVSKTHWTTRRR